MVNSNYDNLIELLKLIRSTSRPLQSDEDPGVLSNQWDEVDVILGDMVMPGPSDQPSNGTASIAQKVKEYLDEEFPEAFLPEESGYNGGVVYFQCGKNYLTIKIED